MTATMPSRSRAATVPAQANTSPAGTASAPTVTSTAAIKLRAEALQEVAARWGAAGAVEPNANTAVDATLVAPQHFALPEVVAAVQDYLAVRAQRHHEIRAHLDVVSEALTRSVRTYLSAEQGISAAMRSDAEQPRPLVLRSVQTVVNK